MILWRWWTKTVLSCMLIIHKNILYMKELDRIYCIGAWYHGAIYPYKCHAPVRHFDPLNTWSYTRWKLTLYDFRETVARLLHNYRENIVRCVTLMLHRLPLDNPTNMLTNRKRKLIKWTSSLRLALHAVPSPAVELSNIVYTGYVVYRNVTYCTPCIEMSHSLYCTHVLTCIEMSHIVHMYFRV